MPRLFFPTSLLPVKTADGVAIRASDYFHRLAQIAGRQIIPLPAILMKAAPKTLMGYDLLKGREPSFNGNNYSCG
jgi:hypothetical protein